MSEENPIQTALLFVGILILMGIFIIPIMIFYFAFCRDGKCFDFEEDELEAEMMGRTGWG